jgi:hypothetical protein
VFLFLQFSSHYPLLAVLCLHPLQALQFSPQNKTFTVKKIVHLPRKDKNHFRGHPTLNSDYGPETVKGNNFLLRLLPAR